MAAIELDEFIRLFELIKKKKVEGIASTGFFSSASKTQKKQSLKRDLQAARESQEVSVSDAMNPIMDSGADALSRQFSDEAEKRQTGL